jgi:hypothetical protein
MDSLDFDPTETEMETMQPNSYDVVKGGDSPISKAAVLGIASQCQHPEHKQFALDMAAAGIRTTIGDQRMYWNGPIAYGEDISEIMSQTRVRCIWDEAGRGIVVYPRVYSEICLYKLMANWESAQIGIGLYWHRGQPLHEIAKNALDQIKESCR